MRMPTAFEDFLATLPVCAVLPEELFQGKTHVFDLSQSNPLLTPELLRSEEAFCALINDALEAHEAVLGVGAYAEDRVIYRKSEVFAGDEARSLHLGLDLWAPAGTAVFAPLPGTIHSFANNTASGDYGPTLILKHEAGSHGFFTLYGHLNTASMLHWQVGAVVAAGQQIGSLGHWYENVHWPPHLHFQIIRDLAGRRGDFPGVCAPSEKLKWLAACPDPNLLLRLPI
jgi:peptidoglycan LD-endopeptidase LytH